MSGIPTAALRQLALQLEDYQKTVGRDRQFNATQLAHLTDLAGASAAVDGVLAWSPVEDTVVVSKGGAWYKMTLTAV